MLKVAVLSSVFLGIAAMAPAQAGCIKGALIGGLAGKMVGHGYAGAAAGCAIGAHKSRQDGAADMQNGRSAGRDRL